MEEQNKLELNDLAMESLRTSAKWSAFLSIIGFIAIGFLVFFAISAFAMLGVITDDEMGFGSINPFSGVLKFLPLVYLLLAVIYFFPVYYLFKYASGMKKALNFRNSEMVADSFSYLKSHHKFLGIMTIIILSLYLLIFIGIAIFAASMAGSLM